jgi:adenylate cyclase
VFEQVRNKLPLSFENLGARSLRNVEHPVEVYRVGFAGPRPRAPAGDSAVDPDLRLAILPFANMSPDPHDEYFADGLTDELISQSSKIPSLRVIARTSVLQYKGSSKTMRDVGRDLGVRLALEGTVRKAGNRLRVTAQLVDTSSEIHLWSSRYDRSLDDIFAIQDDIAGQIATAISQHVAGRSKKPGDGFVPAPPDTSDLEAYANFLRGRKLFGEKVSEETVREALHCFEEAIRRDPSFARARVGIANCLFWLATEGAIPRTPAIARSREELSKALAQNESLAEAHSTLGGLNLADDALIEAEKEARRAIELNPSLSDPYRWLAQLAAGAGRIDEAVQLLESARRIDPLDANVTTFLAHLYFYAGRVDEAVAQWERNLSVTPFRTNAHLFEFYFSRGEFDRARSALAEMRRLRPENMWTVAWQALLEVSDGHPEEARRAIDRLERRQQAGEVTVLCIAYVHLALGDREAYVDAMRRADHEKSLPVLDLLYSPLLAPARSDPRMVQLLDQQRALRNPPPSDRPGPTSG